MPLGRRWREVHSRIRRGYPVRLTSYTGMSRDRATSNATGRDGSARRVHSPSCAMSTTVVAR